MTSMKAGAFDQKNPYECSVQKQISLLKQTNIREGWKIPPDEFDRLAAAAPSWPQGKYCFRSIRHRTGRGQRGVRRTLERHLDVLARQYGALDKELASWLDALHLNEEDAACARLTLANSDRAHQACLEWVVIDAAAYARPSVSRGPSHLADELLALAWMFPAFFQEAHHHGITEFVALGYRVMGLPSGTAAIALTLTGSTPESWKPSFSLAYDTDGFEDTHTSLPSLITKIR